MYISDQNGRAFSLSLDNVIKGNAVDFERVTSLDGTFIANTYSPNTDPHKTHHGGKNLHGMSNFHGGIEDYDDFESDDNYGFDESDLIAEEAR